MQEIRLDIRFKMKYIFFPNNKAFSKHKNIEYPWVIEYQMNLLGNSKGWMHNAPHHVHNDQCQVLETESILPYTIMIDIYSKSQSGAAIFSEHLFL